MTQKDELRERVSAVKERLSERLLQLKAESQSSAREERNRIEDQLGELQETVKGGWEDFTEEAAGKVNAWLRRVEDTIK